MLEHLNERAVPPTRVVVVGSNGFIGNAIVRYLERDGVPVVRVSRTAVDLMAPGAAAQLAALLMPGDAMVAASAIAPVRTPEMLRDNLTLTLTIADAAANCPLSHVVNIGSDAIYADSVEPLTESSPTAPGTLHGIMHLAREAILRSKIDCPTVSLRPTLVYGAGDPHNGYGPNRFRRRAASGEPIVLFGAGEERRDHVYIDDVAELAVRLLYRRSSGLLNATTGSVSSFGEIADLVVRLAGVGVDIRTTPRNGPMPHNGYRAFDNAVCRAAFPDFSYTPLRDGLAKAQREEPTVPRMTPEMSA